MKKIIKKIISWVYGKLDCSVFIPVDTNIIKRYSCECPKKDKRKTKKQKEREKRLYFSINKIKEAGFTPIICCKTISHIQIKEFGDNWNFWAWTGAMYKKGGLKISERGIDNFIKKLKDEQ